MGNKRSIWDKLKSTKLWLALFSVFIIIWIVVTKQEGFNNLAMALVVVPVSYFHENVKQKNIFKDIDKKVKEEENGHKPE